MQDRTGLTVFLVRVVFVLFETRRFCKVARFVFPDLINKWFSTTLTTNLVYDDDVKIAQKDGTKGPRVQFKEILGVGLQFNF